MEKSLLGDRQSYSFTLRHLKQGSTGAVKTWPVAEVLLNYLVPYGGLLLRQKSGESEDGEVLDLTKPAPHRKQLLLEAKEEQPPCFNILELGAGSGYLGIGLALSLNAMAPPSNPRAKVLCTDMDKATIKNMRHNITASNMTKAVRVEPLLWGEDSIDQPKFLRAVRSLFWTAKAPITSYASPTSVIYASANSQAKLLPPREQDDPIGMVTHAVGSDVHYGVTTLEPLSSVVAALKLRNPNVKVILLMKERSHDAISQLKSRIEDKVNLGVQKCPPGFELQAFAVRMRDVVHEDVTTMKILEC